MHKAIAQLVTISADLDAAGALKGRRLGLRFIETPQPQSLGSVGLYGNLPRPHLHGYGPMELVHIAVSLAVSEGLSAGDMLMVSITKPTAEDRAEIATTLMKRQFEATAAEAAADADVKRQREFIETTIEAAAATRDALSR